MDKIQEALNNYWDIFLLSIPKIAISILIFALFFLLGLLVAKGLRKKAVENTQTICDLNHR